MHDITDEQKMKHRQFTKSVQKIDVSTQMVL